MFDRYVEQYGPKIYALCLKLCNGTCADAQDLYQDTWFKAYKARRQFEPDKQFAPWVTRICVNTYKDKLRRQRIVEFVNGPTAEEHSKMLEALPATQKDLLQLEVRDAVATLPQHLKICITLYYFFGYNIDETAVALGIPPGTVKSRLSKARERLRKEMADDEPV